MDARQVIRSPVISEKSYALIAQNKYTFRVHPDAHKTQIRAAVEEIFDVAVHRRAHDDSEVEAQAPRLDVRPHARLEEGDRRARARATASSCSRAPRSSRCRPSTAWQSASTSRPRPGRRFATWLDARGVDALEAREVARQGQVQDRRAQHARPHHEPPPRRRRQAPLPAYRLQAPQGRRPRQGRRDRVRPQPHRPHRAAALPRRREALHPGAPAPDGRHGGRVRRGRRHPGRQLACRWPGSRREPSCTTSR